MQTKIALLSAICFSILSTEAHAGKCTFNEETWVAACRATAQAHMTQQTGHTRLEIIDGLLLAAVTIEDTYKKIDPAMMFQLCQWALATAEQESFFRFAVGGAGEIGPYQFKLNTVRQVGKFYSVDFGTTDKEIVETLLDDTMATYVFTLHFYQLLMKHKTTWRAWHAYNSGKHATQYANEITRRYHRIRKVANTQCN